MLKKTANSITGGLSSPGKMPCPSYSLPALLTCPVGALLNRQPSTSCTHCYATKGRYGIGNVKDALLKRHNLLLEAIGAWDGATDPNDQSQQPNSVLTWVEAMVTLIGKRPYFRWHDSGDIFSGAYLRMMLQVMWETPATKHWIPTKERELVESIDQSLIPPNACFRFSSGTVHSIDEGEEPGWLGSDTAPVAHVTAMPSAWYGTRESVEFFATRGALLCLAKYRSSQQGKEQACGDCRACWSPKVEAIVYPEH